MLRNENHDVHVLSNQADVQLKEIHKESWVLESPPTFLRYANSAAADQSTAD